MLQPTACIAQIMTSSCIVLLFRWGLYTEILRVVDAIQGWCSVYFYTGKIEKKSCWLTNIKWHGDRRQTGWRLHVINSSSAGRLIILNCYLWWHTPRPPYMCYACPVPTPSTELPLKNFISLLLDIFVFSCQTSKLKVSISSFTHHPRYQSVCHAACACAYSYAISYTRLLSKLTPNNTYV